MENVELRRARNARYQAGVREQQRVEDQHTQFMVAGFNAIFNGTMATTGDPMTAFVAAIDSTNDDAAKARGISRETVERFMQARKELVNTRDSQRATATLSMYKRFGVKPDRQFATDPSEVCTTTARPGAWTGTPFRLPLSNQSPGHEERMAMYERRAAKGWSLVKVGAYLEGVR